MGEGEQSSLELQPKVQGGRDRKSDSADRLQPYPRASNVMNLGLYSIISGEPLQGCEKGIAVNSFYFGTMFCTPLWRVDWKMRGLEGGGKGRMCI